MNQVLKIDSSLRMGIRKLFKKGIIENPHVYKKEDPKNLISLFSLALDYANSYLSNRCF